jgi:hypothetical protein
MRWIGKHTGAAKFKKKAEPAEKRGWLHDRDAVQRWAQIDRDSLHPVNQEAYDEIMRKLSIGGAGALSDRERAFLERFAPLD